MIVNRDASEVYADGVLAGLRMAMSDIARARSQVPKSLNDRHREWRVRLSYFRDLRRALVGGSFDVRS